MTIDDVLITEVIYQDNYFKKKKKKLFYNLIYGKSWWPSVIILVMINPFIVK